jgi:periplasmic protein CpxP/Spy
MNKETFYKYMMIGLLCSNLLLLFFYLHKKPRHDEGPKQIIAEKLHFDAVQIEQYELIIPPHRRLITANKDEILVQKNALYQNLIAGKNENAIDSISNIIADLQKKAELIQYHHFEDIQKLCKPEQKADFDNLVKELATLFPLKKH